MMKAESGNNIITLSVPSNTLYMQNATHDFENFGVPLLSLGYLLLLCLGGQNPNYANRLSPAILMLYKQQPRTQETHQTYLALSESL